jgi:hypothetical protein
MSLHAGSTFLANNLDRGSSARIIVSERVAPDGATEDGVIIPVSNGAICSLLQDWCWRYVYQETQRSQLRSLTFSSLYLASDERALLHRHVALVRWLSSPYPTRSQSTIGSGPSLGIAPNDIAAVRQTKDVVSR